MKKIGICTGFIFLVAAGACTSSETSSPTKDVQLSDVLTSDVSQEKDVSRPDDLTNTFDVSSRDMLPQEDASADMAAPPKPAFDFNINPSCDEGHAQLLRFYQSFLGRFPDIDGANHWMGLYTSGTTLDLIATSFAESAESQGLYGGLSNADFVEAAYKNSFGRSADDAGAAFFTGRLDSGESTRIDVLRFFAGGEEMKNKLPYAKRPFCKFVDDHTAGYTLTQLAPNVLYARSADGNVNAVFVEQNTDGNLRVPMPEAVPSTCANRAIPTYRGRPTGHFGGTFAINGNWFGCYLPKYFGGYSVSAGNVLGATNDGREGYLGQNVQGEFMVGYYPDTAGVLPVGLHHGISGKRIVGAGKLWPPTTTGSADPTFTNRNPRTGGGLTPEGYLVVAVVDGRGFGPGMTGTELGNLFIAFGAKQALTFDGGGSSALFLGGKGVVSQPSDGSTRAVANQLVFDAGSKWIDQP